MDKFNDIIRQTILKAWPSLVMRARLRGINLDDTKSLMENMGMYDLDAILEEVLAAGWPCWESADRLCVLLTGETLGTNQFDGIDVTDNTRLRQAYAEMMQAKGHVLARINVIGSGVGHAYIFVSKLRVKVSSPLEGYLYQTNIGVTGHEFDLIDWINDEKSEEMISLPGHLAQLQAQLIGSFKGSGKEGPAELAIEPQRGRVYDENYMLKKDPLPKSHATKIQSIDVAIRLTWRPIDVAATSYRLTTFPLNPVSK